MLSISQAVLRISRRSISHWVASSTSGHWIAWLSASGLPNGLRGAGVLDALVDAVDRRAERRGGLADAVLVHEALAKAQAPALDAPDRVVGDPDVGED